MADDAGPEQKASLQGSEITELGDRLDFTTDVDRNGYVWWYVDGMSDDGAHGLTIIAFIGSVFSPYYARARRRGEGEPKNFIALNVALYGRSGKRWAMTERSQNALSRDSFSLCIGPSALRLERDDLVIDIDETAVPWPRPLKGKLRVRPTALTDESFDLDAEGRHFWSPIAPCCRLELTMDSPSLCWCGDGYLDRNQGSRPLEDDFVYWDWSRARIDDATAILYDVTWRPDAGRSDGERIDGGRSIGLLADHQGNLRHFLPPPRQLLPANRWRVSRSTQCEADGSRRANILETLEDTPFYSRSIIETRLLGQQAKAMHESLSLDRFRRRWVQALLPFRMPRLN